jgi:O-antigen ligase
MIKMLSNQKNKFSTIFYFLFIVFIFFTPPFGSYDIIGPQWFLYSLLNVIILVFIFNELSIDTFYLFFKSPFIKLTILFFILCIFSLLYANNKVLVIHDLSRFGTFFLSIFLFFILFQKKIFSIKKVTILFCFILIVQLIQSLKPFVSEFIFYDLDIFNITEINLSIFKGNAGNKNITAASIVLSLFVPLYLFSKENYFIKFLAALLLFFQILVLFFLSARSSFLSLFLSISIFSIYILYKNKIHLYISFFLLFLVFFLSYTLSSHILPSNLSVASRSSSIKFSNDSSSNRLELWSNAIDHISKHPLVGSGFGNWKVESIKYWGNIGDYYLIPYHAHNDILELTTELGIIGGLSYLFIFITLFIFHFSNFLKFKSFHNLFLMLFLFSYSIDMLLNFPLERPIMQIPLALFIAYSSYLYLNLTTYEDV